MDLSKFTKKTLIEQGIFSQVFKVIENDTENIYSAKISLTELNETQKRLIMGLKREINVIYRLNRRSVLRFIGYIPYNFQQKSHPVFITEYASNGSLYDIIKSERKFIPPTSWNDSKKLISVFLTKAAHDFIPIDTNRQTPLEIKQAIVCFILELHRVRKVECAHKTEKSVEMREEIEYDAAKYAFNFLRSSLDNSRAELFMMAQIFIEMKKEALEARRLSTLMTTMATSQSTFTSKLPDLKSEMLRRTELLNHCLRPILKADTRDAF